MIDDPFAQFRANFLGFLQHVEEVVREAKARGLPVAAKPSPPRAAPPKEFPLAKKDGLLVRVVHPASPTGSAPEEGHPACDPETLARTFRAAFTRIWRKIPGADRQRLLDHWQRGLERGRYSEADEVGRPKPLIQVQCVDPESSMRPVIEDNGHKLIFPPSLVMEHPQRLPWEIGYALAAAYRFAIREHWSLVIKMIDDPFARWERRQGAKATDAQWEKKADALEAKYLRHYEERIAEILRAWGLKEPEGAIPNAQSGQQGPATPMPSLDEAN
jgi:hypothetical protein